MVCRDIIIIQSHVLHHVKRYGEAIYCTHIGIARMCHDDRNEVNSHMTVPALFPADVWIIRAYTVQKNLFIEKSAEKIYL